MKAITRLTGFTLALFSAAGLASGNPVLGTWKLKSYVMTTDTGEKSLPYGEHPIGYPSYSANGRMQAIGTTNGRMVPRDGRKTSGTLQDNVLVCRLTR